VGGVSHQQQRQHAHTNVQTAEKACREQSGPRTAKTLLALRHQPVKSPLGALLRDGGGW
jgi:hypothetical protein